MDWIHSFGAITTLFDIIIMFMLVWMQRDPTQNWTGARHLTENPASPKLLQIEQFLQNSAAEIQFALQRSDSLTLLTDIFLPSVGNHLWLIRTESCQSTFASWKTHFCISNIRSFYVIKYSSVDNWMIIFNSVSNTDLICCWSLIPEWSTRNRAANLPCPVIGLQSPF